MLNVFTKSIIASSAYVSICSYAYYTLLCRVKAVYVAIAINAMHELY